MNNLTEKDALLTAKLIYRVIKTLEDKVLGFNTPMLETISGLIVMTALNYTANKNYIAETLFMGFEYQSSLLAYSLAGDQDAEKGLGLINIFADGFLGLTQEKLIEKAIELRFFPYHTRHLNIENYRTDMHDNNVVMAYIGIMQSNLSVSRTCNRADIIKGPWGDPKTDI